MEAPLEPIIIRNEKIINFYNKNKELDIVQINILYIELFEKMFGANFDNNIAFTEIMTNLNKQNNELQNIISTINFSCENNKLEFSLLKDKCSFAVEHNKNEVSLLKDTTSNLDHIKHELNNLKTVLNGISSVMINKIYETKDAYINDVKDIFKNYDNDKNNNITFILDKQNSILLDKLLLSISDIIPKSQQQHCFTIFNEFKKDILLSLEDIHKNNPDKLLSNIHNIIDSKYDNLSKQFNEFILQSEQRLTSNLVQLNDLTNKNSHIQQDVKDEFIKFFNKYNNSSQKGNLGENQLYKVLIESFPTADIINTSNLTGQCDFQINRKNKDIILVETKEYQDNVKVSEIDKFIRDCSNNHSHGIFVSQSSGIVNKDNFQIDIHNNKIFIYVHHMQYDKYKLSLAVNIIDLINDKIKIVNDKTINISHDTLKNINDEFQNFITTKDRIITDLKDFYKKTIDNCTKLNIIELENILVKHFANSKKIIYVCEFCNKYDSNSLKSLARHKGVCKKKCLLEPNTSNT